MGESAARFLRENWETLPKRVQDYIQTLETNADLAGTVRDAFAFQQNCDALSLKVAALQAEVERLKWYESAISALSIFLRVGKLKCRLVHVQIPSVIVDTAIKLADAETQRAWEAEMGQISDQKAAADQKHPEEG